MCFLDTKELFGLFLGFLQKSSKDHILVQKRQKLKKGEIKFLNGKYNVNQEKKNHVFKCSSQQPPFQIDPRASKTPVWGGVGGELRVWRRNAAGVRFDPSRTDQK